MDELESKKGEYGENHPDVDKREKRWEFGRDLSFTVFEEDDEVYMTGKCRGGIRVNPPFVGYIEKAREEALMLRSRAEQAVNLEQRLLYKFYKNGGSLDQYPQRLTGEYSSELKWALYENLNFLVLFYGEISQWGTCQIGVIAEPTFSEPLTFEDKKKRIIEFQDYFDLSEFKEGEAMKRLEEYLMSNIMIELVLLRLKDLTSKK